MTTITSCISLPEGAQEAAELYAAVFGSSITTRLDDGQGNVLLCALTVAGHDITILNGMEAEATPVSQRITLQVHVDGQEEFDRYWFGLLENGGSPARNGWLVDRFGIWWNIVPEQQKRLFQEADPRVRPRVMQAAAGMERIDIAELERIARESQP